ncbi:MAG: galactose mutarotase [Bacteroidales bacterium]|nr:galactose mutarotase [Bacteroidales bacterium]
MKMAKFFPFLWLVIIMGCKQQAPVNTGIEKKFFGTLAEGSETYLYTLTNSKGMSVSVTNYGGRITYINVPDKNGTMGDVILGFDSVSGYIADNTFQGSLVGRYANRIGKGQFSIDGITYTLASNNAPNHLHGGVVGFDRKIWEVKEVSDSSQIGLELTYTSVDGEEGYPGNLTVKALYSLSRESNELTIDYWAETDTPTIVNLTNHAYYNLSAGAENTILNHYLMIAADSITPVDSTLIPTGLLAPVDGTPFDFRKLTRIGERIDDPDPQMFFGKGYDHNFALNNDGNLVLAAEVVDSLSGRILQIHTTKPGIQFYSGNFLDGTFTGKGGKVHSYRYALCLEPQHFPDSPNKPQFESPVLRPGEKYHQVDVYKFSVLP